ncbi:hypothetical protein QAD02_011355 [Eretmocerus hayati]|uniref:Uncharacterized protein n=1 Tax=Eretmocerus hayati TaxID=131215 RepID=A0ACC2NWX1_9HYME|nr:hypothetical protein QAD02_011355 [Eretmocerus hayati]
MDDLNCIWNYGDGVVSEADFTNYKRFFTLPYADLNEAWLAACAGESLSALIGLGMFTNILGKTYTFKDFKKLTKNGTAILVGALLLKFSIIILSSCPVINLRGPNDEEDLKNIVGEDRYSTNISIATSHLLVGCVPNVANSYAHGNKFITYAIQPIKAGDKLITNVKSKSIWRLVKKSERQSYHKEFYGSSCTCLACVEDWSGYFDKSNYENLQISESVKPQIVKLWAKMNSIIMEWKDISDDPSFPDMKILNQIIDFVTEVCKQVSMPSTISICSVKLLMEVFGVFHDPLEIYAVKKGDLLKKSSKYFLL